MTDHPDPQAWTTRATRTVFRNRWTAVELDRVALPDGREYEYTRLQPAGIGVGVIGFNRAGEVLLEREYRHGVGEVIWQLPGGLTDDGEDLQAAGLRELAEETGYRPRIVSPETVRYLGAVWDNPALGPGHSHLFAAWGLERVTQESPDETELLAIRWRSIEWLREAVRSGEIRDRTVIAAVAYLLLNGWL